MPHRISDLGPLSTLSSLIKLRFDPCPHVSDLSPLSCLAASLTDLGFGGSRLIADLGPLTALTGLRRLTVTCCPAVADVQPIVLLQSMSSSRDPIMMNVRFMASFDGFGFA